MSLYGSEWVSEWIYIVLYVRVCLQIRGICLDCYRCEGSLLSFWLTLMYIYIVRSVCVCVCECSGCGGWGPSSGLPFDRISQFNVRIYVQATTKHSNNVGVIIESYFRSWNSITRAQSSRNHPTQKKYTNTNIPPQHFTSSSCFLIMCVFVCVRRASSERARFSCKRAEGGKNWFGRCHQ